MEKARILVVDDEVDVCNLLGNFLGMRNYSVATALTVKDAIEAVKKERPALVLLDVKLPDASGLDALTAIKEIDPAIKVIMLTALDDNDTIEQSKLRGADDYISKPFNFGYLEGLILQKISHLMRTKKEGR